MGEKWVRCGDTCGAGGGRASKCGGTDVDDMTNARGKLHECEKGVFSCGYGGERGRKVK